MRTFTAIILFGMTVMLLGCGLLNGGEESPDSEPVTPSVEPSATPSVTPTAVSEGSQLRGSPPPFYLGPTSLEERILASPVIARVRLDSTTSTVEYGITYQGAGYLALLEFNFSVQEYLKGSGSSNIVAVWAAAPFFDTRQEAENALPAIVASRDTQWDDREAIVFLQQDSQGLLPSTEQTERYYLSWEADPTYGPIDDNYSIASRYNKLWLPAEAAIGAPSQSSGDQQSFLLDVPPATGTASTITLGEMKSKISTVAAKLNASDGSAEYRECVERTYRYEGMDRYDLETGGDGKPYYKVPDHELDSGLAASSVVYEDAVYGGLPDKRGLVWFDGGDADLFSVEFGNAVPIDFSGDGVNDSIRYARRVVSARPLPAGMYRFHFNDREVRFIPCDGYTMRYEWTVTVNAPEGTLHEAFFDPVTDGTAVVADSTNGVLDPATFTDANSGSATIERIAWEAGTGESGTVKLKLSLHTGIAGHAVNFIALDGSVSLSLQVADATVDATNETLSWPVTSQPWQSGDKLMLRILTATPSARPTPTPTATYTPTPEVTLPIPTP